MLLYFRYGLCGSKTEGEFYREGLSCCSINHIVHFGDQEISVLHFSQSGNPSIRHKWIPSIFNHEFSMLSSLYVILWLFYQVIQFIDWNSPPPFGTVFCPWTWGHPCFSDGRCRLYRLTCYLTTPYGFLSSHHCGMSSNNVENFSEKV